MSIDFLLNVLRFALVFGVAFLFLGCLVQSMADILRHDYAEFQRNVRES